MIQCKTSTWLFWIFFIEPSNVWGIIQRIYKIFKVNSLCDSEFESFKCRPGQFYQYGLSDGGQTEATDWFEYASKDNGYAGCFPEKKLPCVRTHNVCSLKTGWWVGATGSRIIYFKALENSYYKGYIIELVKSLERTSACFHDEWCPWPSRLGNERKSRLDSRSQLIDSSAKSTKTSVNWRGKSSRSRRWNDWIRIEWSVNLQTI